MLPGRHSQKICGKRYLSNVRLEWVDLPPRLRMLALTGTAQDSLCR